ncbi:MAG: cobalt-precorrin-5B (C(1))-methyltransferase [Nitrospiraceae bacterium]|nr:MAG: cobalt-precorrin-5B (C(1))-methyltransferase [Nitrospiraceae bacterium]
MASKNKKLRSGYTTGACAAATAKAAAMLLLGIRDWGLGIGINYTNPQPLTPNPIDVEIPFPDGSRHKFRIQNSGYRTEDKTAWASVIKDAGDDPDVTNGAEIVAEARIQDAGYRMHDKKELASCIMHHTSVEIKGGKGVGIVTKPGLTIPVGEAAINPVPRRMIKEAVMEALSNQQGGDCPIFTGAAVESGRSPTSAIEIIISVTDGEKLAKKTLNSRLGIIGGISILGTTGIVKPISSEAWTATITSSMDVAKAMGRSEIVLSAGRSSEKAHMNKFNLPQESYVMMGDYLEFALLGAKEHGFKKIHLCAQWAKMLKIAMATPQTHVRHGAINIKKAVEFLKGLGVRDLGLVQEFNTAMEIFNFIQHSALSTQHSALFSKVCVAAKKYAESISSGIPVISYLVSYEGEIIANSEQS